MKREVYNLLTLQTRSDLHNQSVLVKCHLNALQFSSHWGFQRTSPFNSKNSWQLQTHFKPSETFQHAHFSSCNPLNCKKSFIKGEALRLLRTNSVRENFEKRKPHFEYSLCQKGFPLTLVQEMQTEVKFAGRKEALRNKTKQTNLEILPFVTTSNTIWSHRISKRFSWNTGTSFNSNLSLKKSLTSHRLSPTARRKKLFRPLYSAWKFLQSRNNQNQRSDFKLEDNLHTITLTDSWKRNSSIHAFIATQPGQYIFRSLYHNPVTDHTYYDWT